MFQYKTRGMVSPQGKRRVYFTCHPEDHEHFFEKISDELLRITDCAVWYSTDEDYEDIETDIGQMNLFVVPITTKLLTKPCRTMELDVPFALKKHIPILPLMQEGGLDELFSRRFGDLQYLDPNARDESAISYDEKLKKYLNSVLIGDELAEKVRAAFDAYIFLSYRKKDRKYANELMRLIHQNEFCRDVAIWYDEFLTPGENFNQAISNALRQSDLFAMVVTPSLVNEINYIQTVEYPAAAKQEKTILPAELEKTDWDELSKRYPGIPNGVDARDSAALADTLTSALANIARTGNDSEPQHNFFIGLAYLDGIDVEVNHKRALSLITFAAESKENPIPEAMEKLVSMYGEGHGVERDYHAAAKWQQRLAEHWETECRKTHSKCDFRRLILALFDLSDQLYALRDLNAAENACKRVLELCESLSKEETETVESRNALSKSCRRLGNYHLARGDLDGAEEYYRKYFALSEALVRETGTVGSRRALLVSYGSLGDLHRARGDLDGAEGYARKALAMSKELAEKTWTVESRRDLSISYERLGNLRHDRGDLDGAEEYFRKELALCKVLAGETETVESRRDLLVSYERLGILRHARGDLDGAEEYFRKHLALSEALAEETGTVEARHDLSVSYNMLGNLRRARGDLDGAEGYYRKDLALGEMLARETGTVESRRDLSTSYGRLGNLCRDRGDMGGAEEYDRKALALSEVLAGETGTVESRRNLAVSYQRLGNYHLARGDLDGAEEYYRKNLALSKVLAGETGTVESCSDLSVSYVSLGDLHRTRGDLDGAEKYDRKALALREALAGETGTVESRRDLSTSYSRLGDLRRTRRDLNGAEEYYRKALALSEELAGETGTVESRRSLLVSYGNLGDLRCARGDLDGAEGYARKALAMSKELAEETETVGSRRDLSISYERLGNLRRAREDLDGAEEYDRKTLALRETLARETGTVQSYEDLAVSYYRLATIRKPYNRSLLEKALQLFTILAAQCPRVARYSQSRDIIKSTLDQLN